MTMSSTNSLYFFFICAVYTVTADSTDFTLKPIDTWVLVNDLSYLNCSNALKDVEWIFQPRDSLEQLIASFGNVKEPYRGKYILENNNSSGTFNLVIPSVSTQDAGRYICRETITSLGCEADLIVLETEPICSWNISESSIFGPEICGKDFQKVELSCSINYFGNRDPVLELTSENSFINQSSAQCSNLKNRRICIITAAIDPRIDGATFKCRTKVLGKTNYSSCSSNVMKIPYAFAEYQELYRTVGDLISCNVSSSQPCNYTWKLIGESENETKTFLGQEMQPNLHGFYICEAVCVFADKKCNLMAMTVNISSNNAADDLLQSGLSRAELVVIVIIIAVVIIVVFIVGIIIKRRKEKIEDKEPENKPTDTINGDVTDPLLSEQTKTDVYRDYPLIIGLDDGSVITNKALKINPLRPSERMFVDNVPAVMNREMAAAVFRSSVYVVGLGEWANEIWKYESNEASKGWNKCASMNTGRQKHSVAFLDEMLYICGGYAGGIVLDSVEAYKAIENEGQCISLGNLYTRVRSSGNCVAYKKSLYIFGGLDMNDKILSTVQVYDTEKNRCHLLSKLIPGKSHLMRGVAVLRKKVILLGRFNCLIYNFETKTWQVRDQFKTNVNHFGLVLSNDRIYVIGGGICEDRTTIWKCRDDVRSVAIEKIFENKPVEWKVRVRLPQPCLVHTIGVNCEMNGDNFSTGDACREIPGSLTSRNDSQELDEHTDEAEVNKDYALLIGLREESGITNDVLKLYLRCPSEMYYVDEMPSTCIMHKEMTAAVYRSSVYVIGLGECTNEIWKYESNKASTGWNKCASMNQGRRKHSAAFLDEMLYICGGYAGGIVLDSVEAYNAIGNEGHCTSLGNLHTSVYSSGNCVAYKKSLYIFGGVDKNDKNSSTVQVYDTERNSCCLLTKSMPHIHRLMRAALWKETVILLGLSYCFTYSFETETWQVMEQFRTDVHNFGLVLSNDRVYVIGGGSYKTDPHGNVKSILYRNDVRSVSIEKLIKNEPEEWKIVGTMPKPCMVYATGIMIPERATTDEVGHINENPSIGLSPLTTT